MKLGIFFALLSRFNIDFQEALKFVSELGIGAIELAPGSGRGGHLDLDELLMSRIKRDETLKLIGDHGLTISAFDAHGNPVHPNREIADAAHNRFIKVVNLAEMMGVDKIIGFSGCPGDAPGAKHPNWVVQPWPDEFYEVLQYQWNDELIPYWFKAAEYAKAHGVKICIEPHPGFAVYNPETLLKLRKAVGETLGCNYDPSHFFWQGIDPSVAVSELGPAIYHTHMKDTRVDKMNVLRNGVIDTKHYSEIKSRAWVFRTVGYGHDAQVWKDIILALKLAGYDGVLSIEHEDAAMSLREGIVKAVSFMKDVIIEEATDGVYESIYPVRK